MSDNQKSQATTGQETALSFSILEQLHLTSWLRELLTKAHINSSEYFEGLSFFNLRPKRSGWQDFLLFTSILLGALLFISGVIFFMAWNWQELGKFAKFAAVEGIYALLALYCIARWKHWSASALLSALALSIGGMMALYGQIYQTGANAWELFQVWSVLLLPLALAGRSTALWFILWLVSSIAFSTWLAFYFNFSAGDIIEERFFSSNIGLYFICFTGAWLAFCEAMHALKRFFPNHPLTPAYFDNMRALTRCVGLVFITTLFLWLTTHYIAGYSTYYRHYDEGSGRAVYILIGLGFSAVAAHFYARMQKDFGLFSYSVLWAAIALTTVLFDILINAMLKSSSHWLGLMFLSGLIIIGMCVGTAALLLAARRKFFSDKTSGATAVVNAPTCDNQPAISEEDAANVDNAVNTAAAPDEATTNAIGKQVTAEQDALSADTIQQTSTLEQENAARVNQAEDATTQVGDTATKLAVDNSAAQTRTPALSTTTDNTQSTEKSENSAWAALLNWLRETLHKTEDETAVIIQQEHEKASQQQPWYIKLMLILGLWIGAILISAVFAIQIADAGLEALIPLGLVCLVAALFLLRQKEFLARQAGVVAFCFALLGCGIGSFELSEQACALIIAAVWFTLWFFAPVHVAKCIGVIGGLCALCALRLSLDYPVSMAEMLLRSTICGAALAYALYMLATEDNIFLLKNTRVAPLLRSAIWGVFILWVFYALIQASTSMWAYEMNLVHIYMMPPYIISVAILVAAGYMAWRKELPLVYALTGGLALALSGYFSPAIPLGILVILAGYQFSNAGTRLLGGTYLGVAITLYYYNMHSTFMHKSIILMLNGLLFVAIGAIAALYLKRSKLKQYGAATFTRQTPFTVWDRLNGLARFGVMVVLLLFAVLYNVGIAEKEDLLDRGDSMLLRLAPVDPRSLMQGDYMILDLAAEREIRAVMKDVITMRKLKIKPGSILLAVMERDALGVYKFKRLDDGSFIEKNEHLLRFRYTHGVVKIASGSFFFEEGQASAYNKARYAELKVDEGGECLIVNLFNDNLKKIEPIRFEPPQIQNGE